MKIMNEINKNIGPTGNQMLADTNFFNIFPVLLFLTLERRTIYFLPVLHF